MKNRIFYCFCVITILCSCERVDDAIEHAGELNFGKAEYIRGWWLGLKPQNPLLTDTIYFDYENLDAGSPVVFEIVSQDGTLMNNADLCVLSESETGIDTVWCKDNCFTIVPPQESVVIGLRFKDEERSDNYGWTLRVKEKGDIERMVFPEGNVSTSDDPNPAVLTFKAQLDKHLNTPRTVTDVVLTLVVVGFLLWILLLRYLFFDRFKTKRLIIEDKDSEHRVEIRGALSLCLTANRQKQSVWERIFVGKRLFYVNDFFEDGDILVTPRNRNTVRLKAPDGYNMSQYTISKNEEVPLKVYNIKNEEVELQIV